MTCRGIDASHSTSETDARGSHYEFRCCSVTKSVVFEYVVWGNIYRGMVDDREDWSKNVAWILFKHEGGGITP